MIGWAGLGLSDDVGSLQRNRRRRYGHASRRRRKVTRLLREDHPVVVVIRRRNLDNVIQIVGVAVRRQTRAQRQEYGAERAR